MLSVVEQTGVMKKLFLTCLMSAALVTTRAQLFSPESLSGAFWGSLIGGIAGGDCRHGFSGEGAAIGAGVGLLAGALAGEARRYEYSDASGYGCAPAPQVSLGYGYGSCVSSAYVYYSPNAYCAPNYYYRPTRPNYALGGTLLGAASGALIGAGNQQAGEGAAIGAATGLVLGSVAEHAARKKERSVAAVQTTTPAQYLMQTPGPDAPAPNPGITSKPCATSTYHWTPRPQIADAPRAPDAPTF
jgi:uncharacterized protein YcfJ